MFYFCANGFKKYVANVMVLKQFILFFVVVFLLTSCATSMLWDATDPEEYVVVSRDEITEAELKEKGLDYEISEKWNVYYVEKSLLQKTKDYAYRSFATPVTITVDVGSTVLVVGGLTYAWLYAPIGPEECANNPVDLDLFFEYVGLKLDQD